VRGRITKGEPTEETCGEKIWLTCKVVQTRAIKGLQRWAEAEKREINGLENVKSVNSGYMNHVQGM
jgi:hypothetical protein